nr:cytochrome P450 2C42-like [Pelodiscus sinensis]|eukprot:XP_014426497.1 cytochrome P450 2C42-like [Pelodiscus sinensis]
MAFHAGALINAHIASSTYASARSSDKERRGLPLLLFMWSPVQEHPLKEAESKPAGGEGGCPSDEFPKNDVTCQMDVNLHYRCRGKTADPELPSGCAAHGEYTELNTELWFSFAPGQPFDPTICLTHTVSNVICSIVFGDRFDYEDQKFLTLINLLEENNDLFRSVLVQVYNFFPTFMSYLPGPHKKILKNSQELISFVREIIKMHKESLDPSCPRDFIDAFLIKMEEERQNGQSVFNTDNLVRSTIDLFLAGTGTTSTTLRHGLLLLLKYPDVEEKVHEEIDRVIGRNRSPCMVDRSQMPYTDAVIHEIQRFVNLVPFSLPHAVTKDVRFREYVIPKGTTVFPSLESVLRDSKEFPNPEQFNPGHFLDENGAFKKSDFFMPFSAGKRICVGEGLARMELFLVLTVILQNFTLKPLIDPKDIDVTSIPSPVIFAPKPYRLCVLPR